MGGIKLLSRMKLSIIHDIKTHLKGSNITRFKSSCFGQFWDLQEHSFQPKLYNFLLRHLVADDSISQLEFKFRDGNSIFGPQEFALITGLRFGVNIPASLPLKSVLFSKVFKQVCKNQVVLDDLKVAFLAADPNSEECFKMALLLIVHGILIARNKGNAALCMPLFHLIDDIDRFNAFPWGTVAYRFFVEDFKFRLLGKSIDAGVMFEVMLKGNEGRSTKKCNTKKPENVLMPNAKQTDCYGFVHALHFWAYETFPLAAHLFDVQRNPVETSCCSRMLCWSINHTMMFCYLSDSTLDRIGERGEALIPYRLQPSELEKNNPVYQSAKSWENAYCQVPKSMFDKPNGDTQQSAHPHQENVNESLDDDDHFSKSSGKFDGSNKTMSNQLLKKFEETIASTSRALVKDVVAEFKTHLVMVDNKHATEVKKLRANIAALKDSHVNVVHLVNEMLNHLKQQDAQGNSKLTCSPIRFQQPDNTSADCTKEENIRTDTANEHPTIDKAHDVEASVAGDEVVEEDADCNPYSRSDECGRPHSNRDGDVHTPNKVKPLNPEFGSTSLNSTPPNDSQEFPTTLEEAPAEGLKTEEHLPADVQEGVDNEAELNSSPLFAEPVPTSSNQTVDVETQTMPQAINDAGLNDCNLVYGAAVVPDDEVHPLSKDKDDVPSLIIVSYAEMNKADEGTDEQNDGIEDDEECTIMECSLPTSSKRHMKFKQVAQERPKRQKKPGPDIVSPYIPYGFPPKALTRQQKKKAIQKTLELKLLSKLDLRFGERKDNGMYNPFYTVPEITLEQLHTFMSNMNRSLDNLEYPFIDFSMPIDPAWMQNLYKSKGWICQYHINVAMHIVALKSKKYPNLFVNSWTYVQTQFFDFVHDLHGSVEDHLKMNVPFPWDLKGKELKKYVDGLLPEYGIREPWATVDSVYGVAYISDLKHWIFYEIKPHMDAIIAYDSICTDQASWKASSSFNKFAQVLASFFGKDRFGVELSPLTPFQGDKHSCGVMAIKIFECLVSDTPIVDIRTTDLKHYRDTHCCEILRIANLIKLFRIEIEDSSAYKL